MRCEFIGMCAEAWREIWLPLMNRFIAEKAGQ
jgi:hypothetical protein